MHPQCPYVMRDLSHNVVPQLMNRSEKTRGKPMKLAELAIFAATVGSYLLMLALTA